LSRNSSQNLSNVSIISNVSIKKLKNNTKITDNIYKLNLNLNNINKINNTKRVHSKDNNVYSRLYKNVLKDNQIKLNQNDIYSKQNLELDNNFKIEEINLNNQKDNLKINNQINKNHLNDNKLSPKKVNN
jgi:hypothetical protein